MRAERVELSRARAHRILSPARLPVPPRPRGGPSRARTGTRLAANEVHCHSCSGPKVPVGRIERPQAQCRAGYSRAPLANRGHRAESVGVAVPIDVAPIPNLAYYLVVNVRSITCLFRQMGKASPSRGGRSRTHVRRAGAGCPYRWTTPLRVCAELIVIWAQEHKRAAPFRKRLLNELDVCLS